MQIWECADIQRDKKHWRSEHQTGCKQTNSLARLSKPLYLEVKTEML